MTTANDVYATRHRLGWTQQQLADILGVTLRTVGNWERGVTQPPSFLRHRLAEIEREHRRKEA